MNESITAELLTIGSELLKGSVLNTNAQFLGRELNQLGIYVTHHTVCDDVVTEIVDRLDEAFRRSNIVILSGGLGPTPDDVTRDAVAQYYEVPLSFSKSQYKQIEKFYSRRRRKVPKMVMKEAMFPENAQPLINNHGIALGFSVSEKDSLIVALPGVPSELRKMFRELVKPTIKKKFAAVKKMPSLVIKTVGRNEADVMKLIEKDFFKDPINFGIYPDFGQVAIRVQAEKVSVVNRLKSIAKKKLAKDIYAFEDISLSEAVGELLYRKKQTVSVAESCTGGALSFEFTKISGSSRYFKGGVTAYHNDAKSDLLGIDKRILRTNGVVSEVVAKKLALGAKEKFNSTYGIGISGVAGPSGGSKKKPVGTVCLSLAGPKKVQAWTKHFWGDRYQVQMRTVSRALEFLWRSLQSK